MGISYLYYTTLIPLKDKSEDSDGSNPPPKLPPKTKSNTNGNTSSNVPDVVANAT